MSVATEPLLAVTPAKVEAAIKRLVEIGKPKKIYLFGSYSQGKHREGSDLDILVVSTDELTPAHQ